MEELIVKYWRNIAKYTPWSETTLRRKYRKELLRLGIVMKGKLGRAKRWCVFCYPHRIEWWVRQKFLKGDF